MRSLAAGTYKPADDGPMPSLPQMPFDVLAVPSERALEVGQPAPPNSTQVLEVHLTELVGREDGRPSLPITDWHPQWETSQ